MRLDQWLDIACLFTTRSEAQKACRGGKVEVNGQQAKQHRTIKVGDTIEIRRPHGRRTIVLVLGLAERHVPKAEARLLYEDRTPAPTPEEIEARRIDRLARQFLRPVTTSSPDKRDRRILRRLKRGE